MRKILAMAIGVLPFNIIRIVLWRIALGYDIDFQSRIGWGNYLCCRKIVIRKSKIGCFNRISCEYLQMDEGAEIRRLNLIKLIHSFHMDEKSQLLSRNNIIGLYSEGYRYKTDCNVYLGKKSLITIGNSFDATRQISIGSNVVFGGKDTQVWTHGFDINRNMVTGPVTIGNDIYIGSRCMICQNVSICDQTVIGAGTCVSKSILESGFYVSNHLVRKSEMKLHEHDGFDKNGKSNNEKT